MSDCPLLPKINPAEYVFGYAKQRELANLCVDTIDEVRDYATRGMKSMQRRPLVDKHSH